MFKTIKKILRELEEGPVKKGGWKPKPTRPKPDVRPVGQNPPKKVNCPFVCPFGQCKLWIN